MYPQILLSLVVLFFRIGAWSGLVWSWSLDDRAFFCFSSTEICDEMNICSLELHLGNLV